MSDDANANTGAAGSTSAAAANSDEATTVSVDPFGKTYAPDRRTVEALLDVEFAVEDDEFVRIVGSSGCGKTTLFHIITDLEDTTSGTVTLDGSPVIDPGTDHGMVFQEYGPFPWRTVSENVTFGLEGQGVGELTHSERMMETLELVGLDGFVDVHPKELSGGIKQRVGIARTLAVDSELFLTDEPFGAVDAQTRDILHGELLDIWAETDRAVLFVTHDAEKTVTLADRVTVMATDPGRIREIASVNIDHLRERTENKFAAYIE